MSFFILYLAGLNAPFLMEIQGDDLIIYCWQKRKVGEKKGYRKIDT